MCQCLEYIWINTSRNIKEYLEEKKSQKKKRYKKLNTERSRG